MPGLYDRYQQGFHQEVYDELLEMQEAVFDYPFYEDALLIAREMMRRVRYNIELLLPRLNILGYQFGKGFWEDFADLSPEEMTAIKADVPIYKAPSPQASEYILRIEQLVGSFPLSLKCWYEEVGCVNLVGMFSLIEPVDFLHERMYGTIIDPLFIYSIEMVVKMVATYKENGMSSRDSLLALSPDNNYKYSFSGSGPYSILLPCKKFDAPLLYERHSTTVIQYLRLCFRWGGFPGLADDNRLPSGTIEILTKGLLPF